MSVPTKRSTICLNMIVKNEAHIIGETLNNLSKYLKFDYWVIGDNGSTDGTQEIIRNFFKKQNVPGELYEDEWVDFGHNRSQAIKRAYNKTDYAFIFDADDSIHGKLIIPDVLKEDNYLFTFGHPSSVQYCRSLMVNNRRKWKWVGVLHEYITHDDNLPLTNHTFGGDYFVISGRLGSRNNDPEKYLKDANVLQKGYYKALEENDHISDRYVFYCAQSYKDANKPEDALTWYIKTLSANGWAEERYYSCMMIYDLCCKLDQKERGMYYLVESIKYSPRRVETIKTLIQHYCCNNLPQVAWSYYTLIQHYYENEALTDNLSTKLFAINVDYYFNLPYFMIIVSENLKRYDTGVKMYHMIFQKKMLVDQWWIKNLMFNLQFFIDKVDKINYPHFFEQLEEYLIVLQNANISLDSELLLKYSKYGLKLDKLNIPISHDTTSENIKQSNKVLIFAGYGGITWNQSYLENHSLGGSETAVVNIARCLPKHFEIYVAGNVTEETIDNVTYVHNFNLSKLISNNYFHTIIVSRYISFMESYPMFQTNNLYIWAHDTVLSSYGCNVNDKSILEKWNNKIDGIICLTEWHKGHFENHYPELKGKIQLINNGLNLSIFPTISQKIPHSFVYSSCSERGLDILLDFWPQILERWNDAQLFISSYNPFPQNEAEHKMNVIIEKHPSITHLGKLSQKELYQRMAITEFWLYPTSWPETSCITALEMLKNRVICLYYPVAGLVNTLDKYGIQINKDNALTTLFSLTENNKTEIRDLGEQYAIECSWKNRADKWNDIVLRNRNNDINMINNTNNAHTITNINPTSNKSTASAIKEQYKDRPILAVYHSPLFNINILVEYFRNYNLEDKYYLLCSPDIDIIKDVDPERIIIINTIFDDSIFTYFPNKTIELLNIDHLNYKFKVDNIKNICDNYKNINILDYNQANINILKKHNIDATCIPYQFNHRENESLHKLYRVTPKEYDFGIIVSNQSLTTMLPLSPNRRNKVVQFLMENKYSVNIIQGWGIDRDKELAKCNFILNIHGQLYDENDPPLSRTNRMFEHLRCDRLLKAEYNILSEDCDDLDINFINKYKRLHLCDYKQFFDCNFINNILDSKNDNQNNINVFDSLTPEIRIINNEKLNEYEEMYSEKTTIDNSKPIWVIFYGPAFGIRAMSDYFRSINQDNKYTIIATRHIDLIKKFNPTRLMCTHQIFEPKIMDLYPEVFVELLNTEPLSYDFRLTELLADKKRYPNMKIFDYSQSNINIMNQSDVKDIIHLPYGNNVLESIALNKLYRKTEKIYDFGIMVSGNCTSNILPIRPPRRNKVVTYLLSQSFSVNLIRGWGIDRDREIAKCHIILNIHGQLHEESDPPKERTTRIFEHIRCDRLLNAKMKILSEDCDYLDDNFIQKHTTLTMCSYDDFFNYEYMCNILGKKIDINNTKPISSINQDYIYNISRNIITLPKKVAIVNTFTFHYEMYGYIINYCNNNNIQLDIYTPNGNDMGWLSFYNNYFKTNSYKLIIIPSPFNKTKLANDLNNNYDYIFMTTDDDGLSRGELCDQPIDVNKIIAINHYYKDRMILNTETNEIGLVDLKTYSLKKSESIYYKNRINILPFKDSSLPFALPCFPINTSKDKIKALSLASNNKDLLILTILGGKPNLNLMIKKLPKKYTYKINVIHRTKTIKDYDNDILNNDNISFNFYTNLDTCEMIDIIRSSHYLLDINPTNIQEENHGYEPGERASGVYNLAYSTLTPVILDENSQKYYNFKNAITYNMYNDDPIIFKSISYQEMENERNIFINNFSTALNDIYSLNITNSSNHNNYCFIHSCNMEENGLSILTKVCSLIKTTKLINVLDKICIFNIGKPIPKDYVDELGPKYYIINHSQDTSLAELPTLKLIHEFSSKVSNKNILYLHTKGISYNNNTPRYKNVQDWVNLMLYFLVEKHQKCLFDLKNNDVLGCDYYDRNDGVPLHFSGNFWWSTSNYIKSLDPTFLVSKQDAEMWICKNNPKIVEYHRSPVDHYMDPYPRKMYLDKTSIKRKVVDGFIFYNEIELLKYRLTILNDYVDYFIISEATHTHIGKEKPLNFENNKHHFKEFLHKIIYVVVDDFPFKYPNCDIDNGEQWKNEKFQRCAIKRGIDQIELSPDDILLINDLDEIPDPKMLMKVLANEIEVTWNILEMDFYYYNLNTQLDHKWWQSKILTYGEMCEKNLTCDEIRFGNWLPIIHQGGWHLSYFGDAKFISNKLQNFTHQEHNTIEMTDIDNIEEKIKENKHLFSDDVKCTYIKSTDNNYLPPLYKTFLRNFISDK